MPYRVKVLFLIIFLGGCNVPSPIGVFQGGNTLSLLSLPFSDNGYSHLQTRVITTQKEYRSFLSTIDLQKGWEHKIAFGMKIAKAHIDFRKDNLLIYRYQDAKFEGTRARILSYGEKNATIEIVEAEKKTSSSSAQAFFYKVPKKISEVYFRTKQRVDKISNSRDSSTVPRECIAWFDGCNHCIRSGTGKTLCTKRHCKKKGTFSCVKWQ